MLQPPHSFHIPVMGTGFTIDTPLKVARYGIRSSISIVDDRLIEKIRERHTPCLGEEYVPIQRHEPDSRARRITAYLNLINRIITKQVQQVRESLFTAGSEITKYFEMLDDTLEEKKTYLRMLKERDPAVREELQRTLRARVQPGTVDVNIMAKVDRDTKDNGETLPVGYSDALSALRGYATSELVPSQLVLSAGFNPRLYAYLPQFDDFYPDAQGNINKKVVLKVSDFRSASIQGRFLAKRGIWVSEFRIESGLNCGGHAFPTQGILLGPALEEFKQKRSELIDSMWAVYQEGLGKTGRSCAEPPAVMFSAQGGVGRPDEHRFLRNYYQLNSIGWATPFLLVPEATNVDNVTLKALVAAREEDIVLSNASPLNVPFYTLKDSPSEKLRLSRIEKGRPGSPCPYGFLAFDTEFGKPLCTASYTYQRKKIDQLKAGGLGETEFAKAYKNIVDKACICYDLGVSPQIKYGLRQERTETERATAICPGPGLAFFSKIAALSEMVGHIYGRLDLIGRNVNRPNFLSKELRLYVDYLKGLAKDSQASADVKMAEFQAEFKKNLKDGIAYYRQLADRISGASETAREEFLSQLALIEAELAAVAELCPAT